MSDSILESTKKLLGIDPEYTAFDTDIVIYINGVLATLNQLGIGPEEGFSIEDDAATWGDFLGDDKRMNSVRTLVYLKVRLLFDPPATSFVLSAQQEQVKELEWRLNVVAEGRGQ